MANAEETEARHYLRDVLMKPIEEAMCKPGCSPWDIAEALMNSGEITWNYRIYPEPQVATFQLIVTATDEEPSDAH